MYGVCIVRTPYHSTYTCSTCISASELSVVGASLGHRFHSETDWTAAAVSDQGVRQRTRPRSHTMASNACTEFSVRKILDEHEFRSRLLRICTEYRRHIHMSECLGHPEKAFIGGLCALWTLVEECALKPTLRTAAATEVLPHGSRTLRASQPYLKLGLIEWADIGSLPGLLCCVRRGQAILSCRWTEP